MQVYPQKIWHYSRFVAALLPIWMGPIAPQAIAESESGAKNMGGSAYFSWRLTASEVASQTRENSRGPIPIGYACLTRDTLAGMARTAYLYRYRIVESVTGNRSFAPLQGVVIRPDGRRLLSKSAVPSLDRLPEIPQGAWIKADLSIDELGQACLDGGISAGMKWLAEQHGKPIRPEGPKTLTPKPQQDPIAVGSRAVLVSQDPKSAINIREAASINAIARHVGYEGDRVVILGSAMDEAGDRWYQVEFASSKVKGWVKGDYVMGLEN